MKINPQIYREYDIRGVVEKDLTPEIVRQLGKGFGTHIARLGKKSLAEGNAEVKLRHESQGQKVSTGEAAGKTVELVGSLKERLNL